ncbi:MAG: hypothetical protein JOZ39_02765 [Chloroflexi bacterium]|nr:hypothetical protein [Chloroflexota bacterium]
MTPDRRLDTPRQPQPICMDTDMIDWFLNDPLAAADYLRNHRVQVLDEGERPRVLVLTRDSVPGLGRTC